MLANGSVAAYITGHEHVFQHHEARGVHSFVAGGRGFASFIFIFFTSSFFKLIAHNLISLFIF